MKTQTEIIKAEAPSLDLLRLAAQGHIAKAHVVGYTKEDGTKVAPHERGTGAKPQRATFAEIAKRHEQHAAQHRQHASKCKPGSVRHGQNLEMAALHEVAGHHAGQAADENLDAKTRAEHTAAHAAVKKALVRLANAMTATKASGTGDLITKALATGKRLVLFQKPKQPKPTGPDLSLLLGEMERAQRPSVMAKSLGAPGLWVQGSGPAFA